MPRRDLVRWTPRVELSAIEGKICRSCAHRPPLPLFRRHDHDLSDDALQAKLARLYADNPVAQPPVARALLTIPQAADGVSDAAAANEALLHRR